MNLFDLEKILFACSVILNKNEILFYSNRIYLQKTLEYDGKLKKKNSRPMHYKYPS